MSGTSETVAACCCPISPCPCASTLSSIVVNWTGSITLTPMTCLDYWQTYITQKATTGYSDCGFICSFSSVSPIVYTIPSAVVSLSSGASTCGGVTCSTKDYEFNRWYLTASPWNWTAAEYCSFEEHDIYPFPTYTWRIGYGVSVMMPTPSNPKWRIFIETGAFVLKFISTDPDYSCTPTSFMLDPTHPLPEQGTACWGNCGGTGSCLTCAVLDVPPTWNGCGFQGNQRRHRITFVAGSVSIS